MRSMVRHRHASVPNVLVIGGGRVASVTALTFAKAGINVVLAVRGAAVRAHFASTRQFSFGARTVAAMPDHVSIVDSENVDQLSEALSRCGSVISCVPSVAVEEALTPLAAAVGHLPDVRSANVTIEGAVDMDGNPVAFDQETVALGRSLPIMIFSHGAAASGELLTRSVARRFEAFPSCFSVLAPPLLNHWIRAAVAAPCCAPGAARLAESAAGDKSPISTFPRFVIGPHRSASLKSFDTVSRLWAPFDHRLLSTDSDNFDAADVVDFAGEACVAMSYCAGVVGGRGGVGSHASLNAFANCVSNANARLQKEQCTLSAEMVAALSGFATDVDAHASRFGRRQVDVTIPEDAARQTFPNGHQSRHFESIQTTLASLGEHSSFFHGVARTARGEHRASKVAETIGQLHPDWERTDAKTTQLFSTMDRLAEGAVRGGEAMREAFADADRDLKQRWGANLNQAGITPRRVRNAPLGSHLRRRRR